MKKIRSCYLLLVYLVLVQLFSNGCMFQSIPNGTKVDDLDLSGLSLREGQEKLKAWSGEKLAETRALVYNKTELTLSLREIGVELDAEKTWERVRNQPGHSVSSVLRVDAAKITQTLEAKLSGLVTAARDASYIIEDDKFVVIPAVPGQEAAIDSLVKELEGLSFAAIPAKLVLPLTIVPAQVTTEEVQALAFDSMLAEYSTAFSTYDSNRTHNLTLAAGTLDKKEIRPGETFSFNGTVGPRTEQTGYKDAKIIINNEFIYGIGGGVCQVSSVLYNTVLLANLPVLERKPHSIPISYIPLGRDAMVNYPDIDFKFRNDTAGIIYLRTEVKSGVLTIRLWGKKSKLTVRLVNEVEQVLPFQTERRSDPDLPADKTVLESAGAKGYIVKTWRITRDDQGKETEQFLGRDVYSPVNRIIRVGTKKN
ncbi:MAG TPA: VanW family protein [Desulfitobacteriaceae bacterium]|nr:VanW family protein [Desulfitobacteriaceae bacterium]